MYGWSLSDTWIERQPRTAPSSWWLKNCSRCRSCRSHAIEPCSPLISKREKRLVAAREAGRLESRKRAVGEPGKEQAGVLCRDRLLDFAAQRMHALADEGLRRAATPPPPARRARAPASMQWASRSPVTPLPATPASSRHVPGAALRQFRRHGPVLEELEAAVEDAPEPAVVDHLPGERQRRHAPVVVPDHVGDAGPLHRLDHAPALRRASVPSGFSHATILPAFAAAMAISACVSLGLAMSIRSMSSRSTSLRQSVSYELKPHCAGESPAPWPRRVSRRPPAPCRLPREKSAAPDDRRWNGSGP